MNISFAETLRGLRLKNDISQQQLADLIHVQRSTIASWETGRRIPDVAMISQLFECLGVDVDTLLHYSEKCDKPLNIILLDDERIILEGGLSVLKETLPTAEISCFTEPDDAIRFVKKNIVQIAFVDIEMGRVSGLDICKELLKIEPNMNVIFLTAFSQYSLDAWKTGACGFIEKPLSADDIRWQIAHLHRPLGGVL